MKRIALERRMKEKDAYDIVYCLQNYPGGYASVAAECQPHRKHGIVRDGLGIISDKFATPESVGPIWYANFIDEIDLEEREQHIQFAYQQVTAFLDAVGFQADEGSEGLKDEG
jgi:hypothetical protein